MSERADIGHSRMTLTGDENIPALPMTDAEVGHLRRLLAWMRTEYMLDEYAQRGFLTGASKCVEFGVCDGERAGALVQEQAEIIAKVPAYVRQAVKMLTKAIADHERNSGVVSV